MTPNEIAKVQSYLRRTFESDSISIQAPAKAGAPIEVYSGEEFVGVLHRDEEDGEISFDLHISILAEDLE